MGNINIAEILKDSPKGTKLYSPIFGDVYLDKIRPHLGIVVTIDKEQGDFKEEFLYDGRYGINGECMLFPSKENRDWITFEISFNDGDIVATLDGRWIGVTTGGEAGEWIPTYCVIKSDDTFEAYFDRKETWMFYRLATEEEKQKLFAAIKAKGYKWNAKTKTLEKLITPKFKVGEVIEKCGYRFTIAEVKDDYYLTKWGNRIPIDNQDGFSLVPNKFDITTLKPFDKVLVRDRDEQMWMLSLFSHYDKFAIYKYYCINGSKYSKCIPYNLNKELLGTINDCDDYYKTWK